jgi:TonB dependent receptor-like, beta-barrel/Carboxypeptidase regulatory-like domain/TonB-dependent Receptor Plug Domain
MARTLATLLLALWPTLGLAQTSAEIRGLITDFTGGPLPGVTVEARRVGGGARSAVVTDAAGRYELTGLAEGTYDVSASLIDFATYMSNGVVVRSGEPITIDVKLTLAVSAGVTVTGMSSFANLADVADPAANLVGVAFAASQGAITPRELDTRPIMRASEVLETVPGLVISQHSGEGKANQYYLRGFNLDHGTDFATTVAGMPINLPTHAHGHGYADSNFLIPELVSGVQYSKGPYFADLGDFTAAGAANINYTNTLPGFLARVSGGRDGWARALVAASPRVGDGFLLYALELGHNDGPWERPDNFRKFNGVLRYSRGDSRNGLSLTALAYRATWDSTDQVPLRAIESGELGRFGLIDKTDGGETSRYGGVVDWQRSGPGSVTRATGYGFYYDLDLFSNFTYFLDDRENGDQFEQADSRFVSGGRVTHRRLGVWADRTVQHTFGAQVRNDNIGNVGLYHTRARTRLSTVREDDVMQTAGAVFYENKYQWSRMIRTELGLRADLYHFRVASDVAANAGSETAGIVSPKVGVVIGPFAGTEFYANAGTGFHSNDARGATITIDPATGAPAERVTPLVPARGAEGGVRTVAIPRTQLTVTLWTLALDSELLFVGDAGTTEASRPSRRTGIEVTGYFRPRPWLTFDGELAWSRARFTDVDPVGDLIPGSVKTVVSAGVSFEAGKGPFANVRLRYFGPRPLIEDDSVRSRATSLVNLQAGYRFSNNVRLFAEVFNLFDSEANDIDYFYPSRLSGEPAEGVADLHLHPTLPRSFRMGLQVGF